MKALDQISETLFHVALDLCDPAQRSAYLDQACAGNAELADRETATKDLQSYLKSRKSDKQPDWGLQVARFLADEITESELFLAAKRSDRKKELEAECEAYFCAGTKRLLSSDNATATVYFERCLTTGRTNFTQFQSAEAELRFLKAGK